MRIVITGAAGFLGLRLVRELLAEHRSADVTQPRFGLSDAEFAELADDLDVLWHCAGDTTLDADLDQLRKVNVDGTRNALALVEAGRRRPMLYHVSTAYVADPDLPPHPLITAVLTLSAIKQATVRSGLRLRDDVRPTVRLLGNPDAQQVPAATVMRALGEIIGVEFVLVRELDDPTALETRLHLLLSATAYVKHQRRYDDARVRALIDGRGSRGQLGLDYLLATVRHVPGPEVSR